MIEGPWFKNPSWVEAFGTIFAATVALIVAFLPSIFRRWNKPKLIIEFENKNPFCYDGIDNSWDSKSNTYFLRLRVKNVGKSTAKNCECKLNTINDIETGKNLMEIDGPLTLRWVGHNRGPVYLNRGEFEYLIFMKVHQTKPTLVHMLNDFFSYDGRIDMGLLKVLDLPMKDYLLSFSVFGDNFDPVFMSFKFHKSEKYNQVKLEKHP